jgi:hypothetical protein
MVAGAARDQGGALVASQVFDAKPLEDASVSPASRVIAINTRTVSTIAEARRLLSARRPALVQFELNGARFFAAVGAAQ